MAPCASTRTWRDAKLHTRCGMGPCQGRVCGAATEFLFGWDAAFAHPNIRPPVFPARVSSLGIPDTLDCQAMAPPGGRILINQKETK